MPNNLLFEFVIPNTCIFYYEHLSLSFRMLTLSP